MSAATATRATPTQWYNKTEGKRFIWPMLLEVRQSGDERAAMKLLLFIFYTWLVEEELEM